MISASVAEGFGLGITELLVYNTLPSISSGKISSVTLSRGEDSPYLHLLWQRKSCLLYRYLKWFAADNDGQQTAVATSAGNSLSSAITSLAFDDCVSYCAEEDAAKYGLDVPAVLTIVYRATVETTDATTGETVSTDVERSASLLVGSVDETSGCYYATVEGSSLFICCRLLVCPVCLSRLRRWSFPLRSRRSITIMSIRLPLRQTMTE